MSRFEGTLSAILPYARRMQVRPRNLELRRALGLAFVFAAAVFLFHLFANLWQHHIGYGYFRDEFYYIACGRHMAWGYVDHGPLVAVQARLAETLFGHSLAGLRAFSALGGSARVFLTGLLAWALGSKRPGQALAMFAVCTAPQYLGTDGYLCMNSLESMFWMSALLALVLVVRNGNPRWWLLFGAAAGLGLLNKPSMAFFLVALLAAILLTRRDLLRTPWAAAGIALMLVIVAPYIHWQIANHWPTWEFLQNGRAQGKNKTLPPWQFLLTQVMNLDPASSLIWIPGLIFLLRRSSWRFLGLTYLSFIVIMMTLHAKDYYVIPIYPVLYAAGGLAWELRFGARKGVQRGSAFAFPAAIATLVLVAFATMPMDTPLLRPQAWVVYARDSHQYSSTTNSENVSSGPLEQFYADRFGWQEEVDVIQHAYDSLSSADQQKVVILTENYGEAGAIDFLGHGLPPARCGQNNYYLWGVGNKPGDILILIEDTDANHLHKYYDSVQQIGTIHSKWAMPFESGKPIWLLRGPQQPIQEVFPDHRDFI